MEELPPYARIVADIRARIDDGELGPGDRVPSAREIIREWGVAMATATKALAALRQEGLVEAVRGIGTVVSGPAPKPRKEPRPTGLTRLAVVETAIAIADAEGTDALSMRRVATSLNVSTMALYRHVANKEALATAMIDHIYAEHSLPEPPPAAWRPALELALRTEWEIYRRHPWAIRLTPLAGPVHAPALMDNGEWMMRVLTAEGNSPDKAAAILTFVSSYTSGMALQGTRAVIEQYDYGLDVEHWWKSRAQEFRRIAESGRYPVTFSITGPPDVRIIFELGLRHLLDGLAPLIESGS
ncbi:GntR family transcriptional regulator [Paractinoplanes lichenicola]|uniref:GntR family transcriptional regulator n=1 Tax=Paractinoplanes lichenicola TaxID=2802976 RepID=A0ABS1VMB4_9ACTN|nr:GntR family transcriptional regulator [Actinoplanes lichenicola]MBL7255784.1 GntR family transcriptional regulator [Actinoplanes lichenicola]